MINSSFRCCKSCCRCFDSSNESNHLFIFMCKKHLHYVRRQDFESVSFSKSSTLLMAKWRRKSQNGTEAVVKRKFNALSCTQKQELRKHCRLDPKNREMEHILCGFHFFHFSRFAIRIVLACFHHRFSLFSAKLYSRLDH